VYAGGSSWASVTSYPTGYVAGSVETSGSGTTGATAAYGWKQALLESEDPGTFTMPSNSSGVVFTIGIRPAD